MSNQAFSHLADPSLRKLLEGELLLRHLGDDTAPDPVPSASPGDEVRLVFYNPFHPPVPIKKLSEVAFPGEEKGMGDLEVLEAADELEGVVVGMSPEAVHQVAFHPVVEVVGCDDRSVLGGSRIEAQACISTIRLGDKAKSDLALALESELLAQVEEPLVHGSVLGPKVVVEVDGRDLISLPSEPEQGGHAVDSHRDGEVVFPVLWENLFDNFDHVSISV